mgnify:CR=1 FL=1
MAMSNEESVEYAGLAATVGRLMSTLKATEAALAQAVAERDDALAKLEAGSSRPDSPDS